MMTAPCSAKRSWADLVKGTSAPATVLKVSESSTEWNLRAEEFVPRADTESNSSLSSQASEFVPHTMNAAAEEFTPIFHYPSTLNSEIGLAEFGQTMEGWRALAVRLESTMSAAAKEFEPAIAWSSMAGEPTIPAINPAFLSDDESDNDSDAEVLDNPADDALQWHGLSEEVGKIISAMDIPSINPAFLSDDEDYNESTSNDGDKESSNGNPESNDSAVDFVEDEDKQSSCGSRSDVSTLDILDEISVVRHEGTWSKEGVQEFTDSDKETSLNESVRSWQHDKDSESSSAVDLEASSMDDFTSVGAPSDSEAEFATGFPALPVKPAQPPPGLSLPPWKLPQWQKGLNLTAADDSKGDDFAFRPKERPWKLAPWKKSM